LGRPKSLHKEGGLDSEGCIGFSRQTKKGIQTWSSEYIKKEYYFGQTEYCTLLCCSQEKMLSKHVEDKYRGLISHPEVVTMSPRGVQWHSAAAGCVDYVH
jgi:hypothetical protein